MGQAGGRAVPSSVTEIVLAGETTAPVLLAMADLMSAGMEGSGGKVDPVSLAAVADNTSGMLSTTVPSSDPAAADVVSVANLGILNFSFNFGAGVGLDGSKTKHLFSG